MAARFPLHVRALVLGLLLLLVVLPAAPAAAQETPAVERIAGDGRVATAIEVARTTFDQSDTVVMAYAHEYPDALVGATLAAELDAPLILNDRDRMFPGVSEELVRLDPERVVLLGGTRQMGPEVVQGITDLGIEVERVAGTNRFATAAAVAERLAAERGDAPETVFVTEGANADPLRGWPDALAVAPYAAHRGEPVLLVGADVVPPETRAALDALAPEEIVVVGGVGAVSERVADDLAADGAIVRRLAGETRFATAGAVYDEALESGMSPVTTWLGTGGNYPDALAAGATIAARGEAFLLVDPVDLDRSPPARERLAASHAQGALGRVLVLGGPAAVDDAVVDQIRRLVEGG